MLIHYSSLDYKLWETFSRLDEIDILTYSSSNLNEFWVFYEEERANFYKSVKLVETSAIIFPIVWNKTN